MKRIAELRRCAQELREQRLPVTESRKLNPFSLWGQRRRITFDSKRPLTRQKGLVLLSDGFEVRNDATLIGACWHLMAKI